MYYDRLLGWSSEGCWVHVAWLIVHRGRLHGLAVGGLERLIVGGLTNSVGWLRWVCHDDGCSTVIPRGIKGPRSHRQCLRSLFLFPPNYQPNDQNQEHNPTDNTTRNGSGIDRCSHSGRSATGIIVLSGVGVIVRVGVVAAGEGGGT